jgi:hypothetical protein
LIARVPRAPSASWFVRAPILADHVPASLGAAGPSSVRALPEHQPNVGPCSVKQQPLLDILAPWKCRRRMPPVSYNVGEAASGELASLPLRTPFRSPQEAATVLVKPCLSLTISFKASSATASFWVMRRLSVPEPTSKP